MHSFKKKRERIENKSDLDISLALCLWNEKRLGWNPELWGPESKRV